MSMVWALRMVLACLRHATLNEGWVASFPRGIRPLATFCDPFGIELEECYGLSHDGRLLQKAFA